MAAKTIEIPDDLFESISNRFGEDALSDFAVMAMQELHAWLSAEERPTSISELETMRIFMIYKRILKDILPTADDIGQLFNLPLGRSRYIVQNLKYRHPEFMKKRQITMIIAALEREEVSDDGLPIIFIPRECEEYLNGVVIELVLDHGMTTTPSRIKMLDSIRFEFGTKDRKPLLNRLHEDLDKLL